MFPRLVSWRLASKGRAAGGAIIYPAGAFRSASKFAGLKTFEEDYTERPEYPPIDPETRNLSETSKRYLKERLEWEDSFRKSGTVEEKLIQLNIRRRYGWKVNVLSENDFGYNCSPYYKYITRTHMVPGYELPVSYSDALLTEKARHFVALLREPLEDILRLEFEGIERKVDEDLELVPSELDYAKTVSVVNQVNRLLIAGLASEITHLRTCQVDHKPKLEAFWFCGGMEPKSREVARLKGKKKAFGEKYKADPDGPVERNFQYIGSSILQLRCVNPIKNHVDAASELCQKNDSFPDRMRQFAKTYGIPRSVRYATCLNGHWSGDDHRSSILSIHPQHHLAMDYKQNQHWEDDQQSALDSQALLCSFSRLLAQAYNFGFDQFTDLDYPFSTQFISTNGLNWSFYTYQLNTIKIANRDYKKNNKQNLCWGTQPMKIMEGGQLNETVLENLIKFYLNPPVPISSPKGAVAPYITAKLNDLDDDKRDFVFVNVREMFSMMRLERYPLPEIYDWERIYKSRHKMMPMSARKRFFEFPEGFPGSVPYEEPYQLRDPKEIPCALKRYRRILKEQKEENDMKAARDKEKKKMFGQDDDDDNNNI